MGNCPCFGQILIPEKEIVTPKETKNPHLKMLLRAYKTQMAPEMKRIYTNVLRVTGVTLRTLNLDRIELDYLSCNLACSLLTSLDSLIEIQLRRNNIGIREVEILCNSIGCAKSLQTVIFTHNQLCDLRIHMLAKSLQKLPKIKILDVSYNSITSKGLRILIEAVKSICEFQTLSVHRNNIELNSLLCLAYEFKDDLCLNHLSVDDMLTFSQKNNLEKVLVHVLMISYI